MRAHSQIAFLICLLFATSVQANTESGSTQGTDSVASVPLARIKAISKGIDKLVVKQLLTNGQKPNAAINDEVFLRRIYLDVVGRIPTFEEASRFLKSRSKTKRAELIDELLDSPGYVSHQYNYWADILRLKTRLQGGNPGRPYISFVKESLAANLPYDQFVQALLNSEGLAVEADNGATGYYLRDRGMPEDNMANTVRIFLGTRLECAQCHDHPFDKWTQREFFEMVAFNGGVQTRQSGNGPGGSALRRQLQKADATVAEKQAAKRLLRTLSYGVFGSGTGLAKLPDSYQYDDGQPNEIVTAKTLFEHESLVHPTMPVSRNPNRKKKKNNRQNSTSIPGAKDVGSRHKLASWLTSPDNPRFSLVIANRLWKRSMGLGLIEPVDDITDETIPSNGPLLDHLTRSLIDLDYDLKQMYRAIYNSGIYQRAASDVDVTDAANYHFPGPLLRRLSAEQLWDSFLTLAVPGLDSRENPRDRLANDDREQLYEDVSGMKRITADKVLDLTRQRIADKKNPKKRKQEYRDAMAAANKSNKFEDEARQIRQSVARLKKAQKKARSKGDKRLAAVIQNRIKELSTQLKHVPSRVSGDLVRASEQPSPAPPGHFLREFGQSDREQIENANSEPAVNQVLSLMNGQIEKQIISNPRTVLMRNVVMAQSVTDKIDTVFLSMLSRLPTAAERTTWLKIAKSEGAPAANDLIWTLANTSEFMFIK